MWEDYLRLGVPVRNQLSKHSETQSRPKKKKKKKTLSLSLKHMARAGNGKTTFFSCSYVLFCSKDGKCTTKLIHLLTERMFSVVANLTTEKTVSAITK